MGLLKFLDKAVATYHEHLPEIMEFTEKMERSVEKRQREKEEKQQINRNIINEYKEQFNTLSDRELINIIRSDESRFEKKAALEILQDRGYRQDDDNVWRRH